MREFTQAVWILPVVVIFIKVLNKHVPFNA